MWPWEGAEDQAAAAAGTVFISHMPLCGESRMESSSMFSGALPRLILHDNGCSMLFHGAF